ncbi:hypothetical protein RHGRI_018462 [Rhododendron griersonianum]|uniref:Aspartate/glutamate/uridylate kinase domain-containing protein n=1 Tax=Rhododendron griersonianum TaxID=479676 RepID=A0AAV6K1S7_9ERIC|nr:hypothetical protein RHGRI_018462 [Rhododendron griersonianum]
METKMKLNRMHSHLCFLLIVFSSVPSLVVESFNEEAAGEDVKRSNFPNGFFFGTSTSSYQIEGAYLQDGKSLSNWDVFTHTPGAEIDGANGDVANNHYNYYLEDIETMNSLGVNAYRFSISWARVLPRGRFGGVNPRGVLFYNDIIDNLLLRGTLFANFFIYSEPKNSHQEDFVHFAETCFESFGDRVRIFDPLLFGVYPPEMRRYHGNELPSFSTEERNFVKGSIDFIGINHYSTLYAKDCIHSVCNFQGNGNGHVIGFSSVIGERDGIPIGEPVWIISEYKFSPSQERTQDFNVNWVDRLGIKFSFINALSEKLQLTTVIKFYIFFDRLRWQDYKRAMVARNTVSGLVLVAKSCINDVPRLTFWLSNTVVLREIISEAFGSSCSSSSISKVMEQCVSRLDVAMFNAILRESAEEIPTDPISDPIVDSKVLPIPAGDLSFGSGAQLKNSGWKSCAVTNLGRGGSDLTATTIGKALGLREIQVWKDVDGVLTCDPSIHPLAEPVPYLTFEEAAELAYFGAQVVDYMIDPFVAGTSAGDPESLSLGKLICCGMGTFDDRNGADVRGYFIWTLMDDFEWLQGYYLGFGLYYIDRKTLRRIPKLSAKWYTDFLTNSTSLDDEEVMSRSSFRSRKVIFSGLKTKQAEM